MPDFPHLQDVPQAYGAGREVYSQIPGEFDQSRWADETAECKLCNVPWCGDYDNVVSFGSDTARDSYLDGLEGYEFETARRKAPELTFNVDIPYTSALEYNYLVIDLPTETSVSEPLPNVSDSRVSRLCYFVDDCRPLSGSTTELQIALDVWTTYINRIDIKYMMLARGHAPMAETSASDFLDAPASHADHLLTPDVTGTGGRYARYQGALSFNDGDMYFAIVTTWNPNYSGSQYGTTRTRAFDVMAGQGAPGVYAVDISDASAFISAINSEIPAMLQTIQAAFFVQKSLVTSNGSYTIAGYTVTRLTTIQQSYTLLTLTQDDFDFDSKYAGIAKLYTSQYSHIEVSNGRGGTLEVAIEDMSSGTLSTRTFVSLAYPYIAIDAQLDGVGTGSAQLVISGYTDHHWIGRGDFAQLMLSLDIPLFEVYQQASTAYDWGAHYTNLQRELAAENQLTSSEASNETANTNALASSNTAYTNSVNSANNITSNNAINVSASTTICARNNSAALDGVDTSNIKIEGDTNADNTYTQAATQLTDNELALAASNNTTQAQASAATSLASGVAEVAANLLTGDIGGAVGAAVSTGASAANTYVSWSTANSSIALAAANNTILAAATMAQANSKSGYAQDYGTVATGITNNANTSNTSTTNSANTSIASNNASLITTNASNTRSTNNANANRTLSTNNANAQRTYDTAISAIENDTLQANMGGPEAAGTFANNNGAVTKPLALHTTLVTPNPGDVARIGDQMLRYGYYCDFAWELDDWVPTDKFCYWQVSDVWCVGARNVAERYQRTIKDILMQGVTVWKDPDEIGAVSIYDNGI